MIEFEDVSLVLSQRQVLENLSFRIESGQIVLLVGGSGTGKSSILRLILRLIPPTSGRIRVLG
ncbi:MAG: ATP-binding cassette domain-containing protein, partial [Calditrichaeota bacterium]|nr:ATP-binding cassette domain-containing protein [Calditrichota bacterium]